GALPARDVRLPARAERVERRVDGSVVGGGEPRLEERVERGVERYGRDGVARLRAEGGGRRYDDGGALDHGRSGRHRKERRRRRRRSVVLTASSGRPSAATEEGERDRRCGERQ